MKKRWGVLPAVVMVLLLAGCSLEDDSLNGANAASQEEARLDDRLYGVWRFEFGNTAEEFRITRTPRRAGNVGGLTYGSKLWTSVLQENFAGDIVYAANFSGTAGVIIIEYWPGHKQVWVDWNQANPSASYFPPRADNPAGNFYGIYFLNMNEAGTQVFLACTNDQRNNYGPTETETLDEAIAKFTQGNMNQMLDLSVGDRQRKVEDY
jgi:hypothetical protein